MNFSDAPHDVLIEVFKRLSGQEAVVCSAVCKHWKYVVDSYGFWSQYCKYNDYLADTESIQQWQRIPINLLKKLISKRAFNRNLLDDDYSTETPVIDKRWSDFNKKRHTSWDTSIFAVESPPNFLHNTDRLFTLDECPESFESCLVSSYRIAERFIYVDLAEYGLDSNTLNFLKPTIVATEYYTNRSDCACTYAFSSTLLDKKEVKERQPIHMPATNTVTINQWDDEYWRKAEHVFTGYKDDKSVVCLATRGKDGQFWAGNYGVKIAGTSLVVKLEFNEQGAENGPTEEGRLYDEDIYDSD